MSDGYSICEAPGISGWKHHFDAINREWLMEYFTVTPADEDQLQHPERILEAGGTVLFLLCEQQVIGTAALVCENDGDIQLAKMGVLKAHRGKGAGKFLLQASIDKARQLATGVIYLETVQVLKPAIHLYEQAGFVRKGDEHIHLQFGRTTFRMELEVWEE